MYKRQGRYLKNPESAAMMDIIYDSFYMDAGVLYTKAIESVHQKLRTLIGTQSSSTVTVFRPLKRTTEVSIKKLNNNPVSYTHLWCRTASATAAR